MQLGGEGLIIGRGAACLSSTSVSLLMSESFIIPSFIYIPACGKSPFVSQKSTRQFKFNVDSNVAMQGQKGLFECIQQKCGSKKLYKCGPLTKKLRIHANEDVYETTKNRMEAIKLEQRKNCTLEIDLNLATVNRKVKVDRNTKLNSSGVIENSDKTIKNQIEKVPKPGARNQPQSRNPNLMKRPLRERIIHMLAVKPHRKIELSVSLRKDGLRESDKTHLISTLSSVATLKGNMYHLLRHVWNDIQEDWPFYNELEKQQMKRYVI
ncbi:hypothetical protein PGB90_009456 [Kerria lacca]